MGKLKTSIFHHLSANAAQLIVNQVAAVVLFYLLSRHLQKEAFGNLNFVLACLLTLFNTLPLGLDQLLIKKVAQQQTVSKTFTAYFFHTLFSGLLAYLVILLLCLFFPAYKDRELAFFVLGAGKLILYFTSPFKQVANGLQRFRLLAYMSIGSNLVKCLGIVLLSLFHSLNFEKVLFVFALGDLIEWLFSFWLFRSYIAFPLFFSGFFKTYVLLWKESLPQAGVVIISALLARFDWVFLGLYSSSSELADYSFAYKVFELSSFPLLVIAPLLLPHFSGMAKEVQQRRSACLTLLKIEGILALATVLFLNLSWVSLADFISAGKYGLINQQTIFILSIGLPFLYLNNFMWTLFFTQGRTKEILSAFIFTLLVTLLADIGLIPYFHKEGAAFGYLLGLITQSLCFLYHNQFRLLPLATYTIKSPSSLMT